LARYLLGIAVSIFMFAATSGFAENAPLAEAMAEKSIGRADAPVTMIEYSSLTCPHCASFHKDALPSIKRDFVDTGKVRIVFWDFPLGNLAMAAAMVARCSGQKNYIPMIDAFFQSQETWARSNTPFDAIAGIARLSGMGVDDLENCLDNQDLLNALQAKAQEASQVLGVESTPTFFIEGVKVPGNLPYEDFKDILNKALAKKQ
jgi:protein-disulfide isomerase